MACNFDPNSCSVNCKKYSMCSYYAMQTQFSEVQSQLNFIYNIIPQILQSNETADMKLNLLEDAIYKIACKVGDSETIENYKESKDEKEN